MPQILNLAMDLVDGEFVCVRVFVTNKVSGGCPGHLGIAARSQVDS